MRSEAERIVGLYQRHAHTYAKERSCSLFEQPWLDRFLAPLPPAPRVLDIGCGTADPIGRYLIEKGCALTGVDSSPEFIELCKKKFPLHSWHEADMRSLALGQVYNGVLAWDSFFHLCPEDQRQMFHIFREHMAPEGMLMFTSGTSYGEAIGEYQGEPLYHASLDSDEYRSLLDANGFDVVSHVVEDPACGRHTIWLSRLRE